jgi:thiamine-phosphate diphosphorylase
MSSSREPARLPPILCFVTPGPSGAQNSSAAARVASLSDLVARAVDAGIDLVQIREPDLPATILLDLVRAAVARSGDAATRIIVNDRVDVALAAGAHGVHLGARSLPAERVRSIVPRGFLVGCSIHSVEEARGLAAPSQPSARDPQASRLPVIDYLVAGTVFPTRSKPAATRFLGTDGLSAIVRETAIPVLAIGGIGLERLAAVGATGAAGFAAIRLFADASPGELHTLVERARRTFDTPPTIP